MKKTLLTVVLAAVSATVFAQGKIVFENDSLHLVYLSTDTSQLLPWDAGLAGQPVPPGFGLQVDLWAGSSSSLLSKVITTTMNSTPGEFGPVSLSLGLPADVPAYFQVEVYSAAAGSYFAAAAGNNLYYGESPVFTCVLGSLGADSIVDPRYSTWRGGIVLQMNPVPEPSVPAMAGLGAVLVGWRRRI